MIFSRNKYKKLKKIKNQSRKHCKKWKRRKNKKRRKRRTFRNKNYINLHNKTVKKLKGGVKIERNYRRPQKQSEAEIDKRLKEIDKILESQNTRDKLLVRIRDTANKFGLVLPENSKIQTKYEGRKKGDVQFNFKGKYSSKNPSLKDFGNEVIIHIPNSENKNKFTKDQYNYDSGEIERGNISENNKRIGYAMGMILVEKRILKIEIWIPNEEYKNKEPLMSYTDLLKESTHQLGEGTKVEIGISAVSPLYRGYLIKSGSIKDDNWNNLLLKSCVLPTCGYYVTPSKLKVFNSAAKKIAKPKVIFQLFRRHQKAMVKKLARCSFFQKGHASLKRKELIKRYPISIC